MGKIHTSALTAKIQPIEFQNQRAVQIRSLAFLPVDGRPHPVSVSIEKRTKIGPFRGVVFHENISPSLDQKKQ